MTLKYILGAITLNCLIDLFGVFIRIWLQHPPTVDITMQGFEEIN